MEISNDGTLFISLLYVEDEIKPQELVTQYLRSLYPQLTIHLAQNGLEGLKLFEELRPDIVVTDIRMPIMNGIQMSKKIKELNKDVFIIVTSASGDMDHILEAIDIGINNYVLKPIDLEKFNAALEQCVEKIRLREQLREKEEYIRQTAEDSLQSAYAEITRLKNRLQAENNYLQLEDAKRHNFGELVGSSSALATVCTRIKQVAPLDTTVLLLGETGSGKGVVARAVHGNSTRKSKPLVTVNCSSLPATLVESELFGREKGAFTGSYARQIGRFELADGGTIFLDEIGDMPMELQPKLLRVLQDGEFERLGSSRTIKVDVRIIAATNRNLEEQIHKGKFRKDLYYRLNVFPITLPPLRQRTEDIPQLVRHFVAKYNAKIGKQIEIVPNDTIDIFQKYRWPGNVRELESVIERAVIVSQGATLKVLDHFDMPSMVDEQKNLDLKSIIDLERDHILQALQTTNWRVEGEKGAAVILGLNPSTLRGRMRKYGITRQ